MDVIDGAAMESRIALHVFNEAPYKQESATQPQGYRVRAMRYARATLDGAYQGVIRFFKGRDIADVFEEFSEDALARGLKEGLIDGHAVLRDLRKVEQATGMPLLPDRYGYDPANQMPLLEGFSKLARAHAWGNVRTGVLPAKTARWMDMLVATQAGMLRKSNALIHSDLARAGQFKEALAKGEVPAELEKLLGESIGIGREPTGAAARPEISSGAHQHALQLSPGFSISRAEALKLRKEIEEQVPLTASTQGIEAGMTAKEAVRWAKGHGAEGTTSHPEIGEVGISTRSIKNAIGHLLNPRKAVALLKMKELIPASKLIHRHVRGGRPDSYRLAGRIDIDGVEYVARIIIDTDNNGNRFYNHELSDLQELRQTKGPQTLIPGVDPKDQQIGVEELEDTGNLLRWIFSVKADEAGSQDASFSISGESVPPDGLRGLLGGGEKASGDHHARDEFVHKVWSALAQHDELFQYGRTTSKDAVEIARAVSRPGREVKAEDKGDSIEFEGYRGFLRIYDADTDRPYIWSPYTESQGEKEGGGAQLYAAALDWIHNNGKRVKDDWRGLSDINAKRRTSNFLASALRWGTTNHLEPHAKQGIDAWTGDEVADFAALARKEMENVFEAIPEARGWTFDFGSGSFTDADGRPLARDEIEAAIARGEPGRSGVGLSTLQRGVLTASALQNLERGRASDALEPVVSPVLHPALHGVSYSIAPIGPGAREINAAPPVLETAKNPFSGVQATTPSQWRPIWAAWLKENKRAWAGEGPVQTPEGPIAITTQTADHVRAVRDGEKAALHFEAAVRIRELLEKSVLVYVGAPKQGEQSASEIHRRYAWMKFADGETRHVLLTVKRWDEVRNADTDTAYAVEALEVKSATDGTLQASETDDKAITGSADMNLARFRAGIKPEHRK